MITYGTLKSRMDEAYSLTSSGKFPDSLVLFRKIIQSICLSVASDKDEVEEINRLLNLCKEYVIGVGMELARKELSIEAEPKRVAELSAYFASCQLDPSHTARTLQSAMIFNYKIKNFATTLVFARKLLEYSPPPQTAQQARKLITLCERTPVDEVAINYDQYNPFVICGSTFTPIYRGSPSIECPYCRASYVVAKKGKLCQVCELSNIGTSATGLSIL